jgi:hypothetical protein
LWYSTPTLYSVAPLLALIEDDIPAKSSHLTPYFLARCLLLCLLAKVSRSTEAIALLNTSGGGGGLGFGAFFLPLIQDNISTNERLMY